jgi:uncharacterized protein (TIGR02246 family)
MSTAVVVWSAILPVIALVNMLAWSITAASHWPDTSAPPHRPLSSRQQQVLLSAGYVFGCAFRSVVPVFDVPRIGLIDSVLSSALLGRSVATVAELCFIAQWAVMLRATSMATRNVVGSVTARVLVPLIVVAETCSWYSVLTTSNLGHVFEESLWGVAAALIVASLLAGWSRWDAHWRRVTVWLGAAGLAYVAYLALVDVPMYWSRWIDAEQEGRRYLSLMQGLADASAPKVVSYRWEHWRGEIVWMSIYFSVAVWVSIWLIRAPMPATAGDRVAGSREALHSAHSTRRNATMKNRRNPSLLASVLLCAAALSPVAQADVKGDVEATTQKWISAFNHKDTDAIVALYAPDAVFHGTSSPVLRDSPALVREYFKGLATLGNSTMATGEHRVQVLGQVAINSGFYTRTSLDTGKPVENKARFTFVYALRDGQWLIVAHHSSALP